MILLIICRCISVLLTTLLEQGLGNKFLDDLRQADVLLHIIDVSGTTNEKASYLLNNILTQCSFKSYKLMYIHPLFAIRVKQQKAMIPLTTFNGLTKKFMRKFIISSLSSPFPKASRATH